MKQLDLLDGRTLAVNGATSALEHADEDWRDMVESAIRILAATGNEFTMNDVRAICDSAPMNHNAWGGAMLSAHQRGVIRWTGKFATSKRTEAHVRPLRIWVGAR